MKYKLACFSLAAVLSVSAFADLPNIQITINNGTMLPFSKVRGSETLINGIWGSPMPKQINPQAGIVDTLQGTVDGASQIIGVVSYTFSQYQQNVPITCQFKITCNVNAASTGCTSLVPNATLTQGPNNISPTICSVDSSNNTQVQFGIGTSNPIKRVK